MPWFIHAPDYKPVWKDAQPPIEIRTATMSRHPSSEAIIAYGFTTKQGNRVTITELPDGDAAIAIFTAVGGLINHLHWEQSSLAQLHDAIGKFLKIESQPPGAVEEIDH